MGHRLSRIVTRTGDDGSTGLGDGTRTPKDALRVHALGEVDELNAALGVVLTEVLPEEIRTDLLAVQHDLFDLGAELCIPGHTALAAIHVERLDARLAHYNASLPPLAEFILPGGSRAAAQVHVARTVCRRAERGVVTLARNEAVQATALQYLNRLSDLLFVLARVINRSDGGSEVLWQRRS
mgnify:CR=1 FL=1